MQRGQDNAVCLESCKTLGKNNTARGDERLANPSWLWELGFPNIHMMGAESPTQIISSVSVAGFWRFIFFFLLSLAIHSLYINTVCAINISLE